MTSLTSPSGQVVEAFSYDDFQGIDSSRDIASLDTGTQQRLYTLHNGYASFRGIMLRDRGFSSRKTTPGDRLITHTAFFGRNLLAWAQQDGGGTTLAAEPNGIKALEVYPSNATVSTTIFGNKLVFLSPTQNMWKYDGLSFALNTNSKKKPAFAIAIQRRLATVEQGSTIIDFSRVDDDTIYTGDESPTETAVTKASDIDIRNIIGTNDFITGLGVFEKSRLAVFTNDQCLIYNIGPDYTKWIIDDKASIGVGCVSHNSIANVGTDIIFCSRSGVHSLRRSDNNGITIYTVPLSSQIEELYKSLYTSVIDKTDISGFYDQDNGQYHAFFPQSDKSVTRLTLTISPDPQAPNKWSTASYLNARCGTSSGGFTVLGTSGGVFDVKEYEDATVEQVPDMEIVTPILWHGSITETKQAREFILQASGQGRISIEAYNQDGTKFAAFKVDISPTQGQDDDRTFLPLMRQYNRAFTHQYKGVQFRMKTEGGFGRIKIIGFAIQVEVDSTKLRKRER